MAETLGSPVDDRGAPAMAVWSVQKEEDVGSGPEGQVGAREAGGGQTDRTRWQADGIKVQGTSLTSREHREIHRGVGAEPRILSHFRSRRKPRQLRGLHGKTFSGEKEVSVMVQKSEE